MSFQNLAMPFVRLTSDSLLFVVERSVRDGPYVEAVHDGQHADQRDQQTGRLWNNTGAVKQPNGPCHHQTAQSEGDHTQPGRFWRCPTVHGWCNPEDTEGVPEPREVDEHHANQTEHASCERRRIPRASGSEVGEGLEDEQDACDEKTHRVFSFHHLVLERHA